MITLHFEWLLIDQSNCQNAKILPCLNWDQFIYKIAISLVSNVCISFAWLRRGICGSFFLLLSFSRSQVINFWKWKHHYLSKNITIFHSNDDFFTQYLFLNKQKRCHLMTFSWWLESERIRVKHYEKKFTKLMSFGIN